MARPTDRPRCGKDRSGTGQLHFHYCHLERGHSGEHECACGERFWTLLEQIARDRGEAPEQ